MTIYVVEFFTHEVRTELRVFRTMVRMEAARVEWNSDPCHSTRTIACFITDAEMKESP